MPLCNSSENSAVKGPYPFRPNTNVFPPVHPHCSIPMASRKRMSLASEVPVMDSPSPCSRPFCSCSVAEHRSARHMRGRSHVHINREYSPDSADRPSAVWGNGAIGSPVFALYRAVSFSPLRAAMRFPTLMATFRRLLERSVIQAPGGINRILHYSLCEHLDSDGLAQVGHLTAQLH